MRSTDWEAFEPLGDGKEATGCENMDEGPPEQDGISGDSESDECSTPQPPRLVSYSFTRPLLFSLARC